MKKNRLLACLLVLCLILGLAACGESAASVQESAASEPEAVASVPEVDPVPVEAAASTEESPAEVSVVEEAPQITIEYPIEGDYHFTMIACKNNVTAEIFGDGGFEQTEVYQYLAEHTGVTMEFTMLAEQTVSEKLNLIMASGDLPDIFNSKLGQYDANGVNAIADEIIIDLSEYIDENAPDYVQFLERYPDVKASAMNVDGSIPSFLSSGVPIKSKGMSIRGDWLDELGLETPTTLEELTSVLEAFKSEKGATMPLLVTNGLESGIARYFQSGFTGFRSVGYQLKDTESGEVTSIYAHEGFIEYLEYMRDLYAKGLLTNDFLTTGREYGNFEANYYNGTSGVWEDGYTLYSDASLSMGQEGYDPRPFNLTGEDTVHVSDVSAVDFIGTRIFISATCENPEIAVQVFNYCYTEEGRNLTNFGVEGVSYEYNADGEIEYTELLTNNPDGYAMMVCKAFYTGMWLPTEAVKRALELNSTEKGMAAVELWTEGAGDTAMNIPNGVSLGTEEQTEFANLAGDIQTAVTEAAYKVVTNEGGYTIDDYRALLEEMQGTGLARMDELYQEAYDAFMGA